MRYFFVLILYLWPISLSSQHWEDQRVFQGATPTLSLRVLSSTDTSFFVPIITSFLKDHPEITVEYFSSGTTEIDRVFRQTPDRFDVVISSAMDLQLKLTNDGYAQKISDVLTPDWAQWRHSLFAFTAEPAAIVLNRAAFEGLEIPQTRQDLIEILRTHPALFRNKLATYDIRQSGLGYLFATQDARASETYWRLMEVMGGLGTRLYCCSGEMIDDLSTGDIAVAYNVLGSYVSNRAETAERLSVVLPSDFPITMMRTGFVSSKTLQPDAAKAFIRHLIEVQSGDIDRDIFLLPPLLLAKDSPHQSTISFGPALMTYLDTLKRNTFLQEWVSAVIQ